MKIKLFPFVYESGRRPSLNASVKADVITINGSEFDFSPIPEGYRIPASAVDSPLFVKGTYYYIERRGGEIHLTLYLPVEWDSPIEARAPGEPTILTVEDGPVPFPDATPKAELEVDFTPPTIEDFNAAIEAMKK